MVMCKIGKFQIINLIIRLFFIFDKIRQFLEKFRKKIQHCRKKSIFAALLRKYC
jgi:hypothetical protein